MLWRLCFKSCPRVGGHQSILGAYRRLRWCFKSCPRVGGITEAAPRMESRRRFKSCPRVGGITQVIRLVVSEKVSSRAPVWGASCPRAPMGRSKLMFQVVPPCGGHPGAAGIPWCGSDVSSRAPVWGASVLAGFFCLWVLVSSRAPVWGASRTLLAWRRLMVVSSRAPVWGASIFCWLSPT